MPANFFDNLQDHSEIKLRILERFLTPWSAKLGSWNETLWYVDGFAGPGKYQDGSDGSPLLGMNRAGTIRSEHRKFRLSCFFVEKNRENHQALEKLAIPFRRQGLVLRNRHDEFASVIPEIAKSTVGFPVLLFVDPFGISPLKYAPFQQLLKRRWPLDVILTFQHTALHRLAKDHPHLITEAIGTDAWEAPWRTTSDTNEQTEYVLEAFRGSMQRDGEFLEVFSYPIRPSKRSAPKYYLLFASRHYDAFELWNDQVVVEEATLSSKEYQILARQSSFLPSVDDESAAFDLLDEVRQAGQFLGKFTRRDLVMYFVRYRWGHYSTKEVKKVVGSLIASEEIFRERGSGENIDSDNLYYDPH